MEKLTLENLTYRYPGSTKAVLQGLSADFFPGEMTAVIGPSGSGKSTLLSLLAGLDRPAEGRILLNGEEIFTIDPDRYRRERVAVIFQSFQLFPLLTVLENVCVPRELQGWKRKDAEENARALLRQVGISQEQEGRFPAQLSGGAKVLLADEPTGNLDGENSRNIVSLLRRLAGNGYCVIIVTHDMSIAAEADRVYEMRDGTLQSHGGK